MLARGPGAFVAKVNAAGTKLEYLTYLGPGNLVVSPFSNPANRATALAVDTKGNAYIAGSTFDPNFPATPGAYQTAFHGPSDLSVPQSEPPSDAFAIALNPTANRGSVGNLPGRGGSGRGKRNRTRFRRQRLDYRCHSIHRISQRTRLVGGSGLRHRRQSVGIRADFFRAVSQWGCVTGGQADAAGLVHIAGPGGSISTVAAGARPSPRLFGVANAAWGPLDGRIAAMEVVSLYGPHIGPVSPAVYHPDGSGVVPKSLGGVQVFFNDLPAPLLYVSDSQINAVAPLGVANRAEARIRVVSSGASSPDFTAVVVPAFPQIFQASNQSAAAVNQDGSINSVDHPAPPGSIVSIWVTGGLVPGTPDGEIANAAHYFFCCQVYEASTLLRVAYSGAAPGIVAGVTQINFQVPEDADGLIYVTLEAGARVSNPAYVAVGYGSH